MGLKDLSTKFLSAWKDQTMSGEYDSLNAQNKRKFTSEWRKNDEANLREWRSTNVTLPLMHASFTNDEAERERSIKEAYENDEYAKAKALRIPKEAEYYYDYYGNYYPNKQGLGPKSNMNPFNKTGAKLGNALYNLFNK